MSFMTRAHQRNAVSTLLTCSLCIAQIASAAGVEVAPRLSDEEFLRSFKIPPPTVAAKNDPPPPPPNVIQLRKAVLEDLSERRLDRLPQSLANLGDGLEIAASEVPASNERIDAQFKVSLRLLSQCAGEIATGSEHRTNNALSKAQKIIGRMDELRPELFATPEES